MTIALYGACEDEPQRPGAPRPAYRHSKDCRADLKQVLLSLGVSGDGGLPLQVGFVMVTAEIVWKLRLPLRSAWSWAWKGCVRSWRIVKHTVAGHEGCASNAVWA